MFDLAGSSYDRSVQGRRCGMLEAATHRDVASYLRRSYGSAVHEEASRFPGRGGHVRARGRGLFACLHVDARAAVQPGQRFGPVRAGRHGLADGRPGHRTDVQERAKRTERAVRPGHRHLGRRHRPARGKRRRRGDPRLDQRGRNRRVPGRLRVRGTRVSQRPARLRSARAHRVDRRHSSGERCPGGIPGRQQQPPVNEHPAASRRDA